MRLLFGFLIFAFAGLGCTLNGQIIGEPNSSSSPSIADPLLTGIIGLWHFDELAWTGSANEVIDSSGKSHHGSGVGGGITLGANTPRGNAGTFAANSYINVGDIGERPIQGTISMWIRAASYGNYYNPFTTGGSAGTNNGFRFELNAAGVFAYIIGDNSTYDPFVLTNSFGIGQWRHIAITWDSSVNQTSGYLDGVKVIDGASATHWATRLDSVQIGIGCFPNRGWRGSVDEVVIWDRALSSSEISSVYQKVTVGK